MLRMLVIALLAVGTAVGPFAAGSQGAGGSSSAQRAALRALDDVSTTAGQLERLRARMMALDGKMSALYRTLSGKVASVGTLAATPGVSQSALMQVTQQMQQMQMSFNLQYLQLQENMQNDARQYTSLSSILKTKQDAAKAALANMK